MTHRLLRPTPRKPQPRQAIARRDAPPAAPSWPSFTGSCTYVGTTPDGRVTVFVDATLGPEGVQNAADLLADAPRVCAFNDGVFAAPGGAVNVIVFALGGATDGTGGADHMGCDFVTGNAIEVCASFGQSARCSALFEAELSECSMGGSLCGLSTGEALSRWCAMDVSANALGDFASAPVWAADGMPNFVDTTDPTDQNYDSTGCGMAFLSWLQSLEFSFQALAQEMVSLGDGATFAQLYQSMTGDAASNAWTKFQAAVAALPFGVVNDDPFAGVAPPGPTPAPPSPAGVTLDQAIAWATQGLTDNWTGP